MEAPLLENSSGELKVTGEDGDYVAVKGLRGWWRVLCAETGKLWSIAGPIVFQIVCQYSVSFVTTIFVGHLGDVELSAFSIAFCVIATFAFGFMNKRSKPMLEAQITTYSVRVSNELGMGHPRAARYSVYTTLFQSLLIGILCMIVVLATRNHFSLIFTSSEDMKRAVARLSPLLGITMLLNSIQPVISGVAIGGGWQSLVAYINLASYYIFGLPFGYFLGYVANLGVAGLWGGMIAGVALQTLLLMLVLYRTNWNKELTFVCTACSRWTGHILAVGSMVPKVWHTHIAQAYYLSDRAHVNRCRALLRRKLHQHVRRLLLILLVVKLLILWSQSLVSSDLKEVDSVIVEQTTERMRKWGGQYITIDELKIEGLPKAERV